MPDEMESSQNPTEPSAEQPMPEEQPAPEAASSDDESDALAAAALASAQAAIEALNAESEQAAQPAASPTPKAEEPTPTVVPEPNANQPQPSPLTMPDFAKGEIESMPKGMDLLSDVNVDVTIELGRTRMLVEDVLRLAEGAVVELDKLAGDPVDIYVNKRLVARGEVLVLNDNFCIRVNDILDADLVEQERN